VKFTNDSIQFMGFQLEVVPAASGALGNVPPTNFEHRDAEVELALAQRYAWLVN
jgi:hypothetical protein